ncbi:MAG: DUF2628 domain-containing protein [Bacteroidales bacterium]|nr:DUF2628 domain-containing protein [Bacteroidales bacterium]
MANNIYNNQESTEFINMKGKKIDDSSWNWGAFSFPIIWGLFHGVYWPIGVNFVILIIANIMGVWWTPFDVIPNEFSIAFTELVLTLVMKIILGLRGDNMGDFSGCTHENIWDSIGKVVGIIEIISCIGLIIFIINHPI